MTEIDTENSKGMLFLARWAEVILAALMSLAFCLLLQVGYLTQRIGFWALLACAAGGIALFSFRHRMPQLSGEDERRRETLAYYALAFGALLFLVSRATSDRWFYFLRWLPGPRTDVTFFRLDLVRFILLSVLLTGLFIKRFRRFSLVMLVLLAVTQFQCIKYLFRTTGGGPLYGDDHPSFMLRFYVFARTFPQYIYYNPLWNGGRAAPFIIVTGTVTPGLLLWPLWRFFPIELVYTPAMALLFIVIVPAVAVTSVRISGGSWTAAFCTGLLALGVSRQYFLWLLHFGTVGACACLPFVMLFVACLYRVIWLQRREWWTGVLLVLSTFFFVAWPPASLMALAVLPAVAISGRTWKKPTLIFLVLCGLLLAIVYFPFFRALMGHAAVSEFSETTKALPALGELLRLGCDDLSDHLRSAHPLILFFGLVGVALAREPGLRRFYGTTLLGLAFLCGWGDVLMPELSLSRAGMPLMFLATIPAGFAFARIYEKGSLRAAPLLGAFLALLLLGGYNVQRIYANKCPIAPYRTMSQNVKDFIGWIETNVPENARFLYAGATLHAYGGGHVAMLPVLTGREMMASDYYHFGPDHVDYHYPPRPFRKKSKLLWTFMNMYNVSHVITRERNWREFFLEEKHADQYEEVRVRGDRRKTSIYRVHREPSFFEKGRGRVEADINIFRVQLDEPAEKVVLRYNWADGLVADPPVELEPYDMGHDVRLIAVRPHGQREFEIRYKWSPWK